ncbi:MAG: AAA family ATPase [Clostridia bacterium]|nr:AAA family ATPase [Clostridia bacterium]
MKSFIDALLPISRLGLIHGRVNDLFLPPDMQIRDIEQYLLDLLKSHGFKHIIFYGSEGNRGAFTLDQDSARFFFDQTSPTAPLRGAPDSAAADLVRRRGAPNLSSAAPGPAAIPAQENRIVFSKRNWQLPEFVAAMLKLQKQPDASMAIIFYNILTTPLGASPALIDELLTGLQRSLNRSLCLMIAPGTEYNCTTLIQTLASYQLSSYFTTAGSMDQASMNPQTTFRMGAPGTDELLLLLKRLQMGIGTQPGRRLRLGAPAGLLAEELVYASRFNRSPDAYCTLRELINLLTAYTNNSSAPLTCDAVDRLLEIPVRSRVSALESVNRPGWEPVYREFSKMDALLRKRVKELRDKHKNEQPQDQIPSLDCLRACIPDPSCDAERVPVPNFLLMGNPGTGKSTLSRYIGQILKEANILRLGHVHQTGQDKLVSSLVGGVRQNVLAACDAAEEGVLVIDDAQSICKSKDGGVNHAGTGIEIVETLVRAMTSPERHFCLVLCGYESEVREVLKMDDGLPRRFNYEGFSCELVIPDYEPDVLRTILLDRIAERGCTVDPTLLTSSSGGSAPIDCFVQRIYDERNRRSFGNADAMIKLANAACDASGEDRIVGIPQFCLDDSRSAEWFRPRETAHSLDAILRNIRERMVGMETVSLFLSDREREIRDHIAHGLPIDKLFTRAIAIEGNPGVGKTTVANMLGSFYYGLGLSATSSVIAHSASELNSPYSGGNEAMILEWIRDAADRKGVLFVDEAHQLIQPGRTAAYEALMAPLTDRSKPFQLVLAGYPEEMEQLIQRDKGGSRRFMRLVLNDYTGDELLEILLRMMQSAGQTADEDAVYCLHKLCQAIYETRDVSTGNGGAMEILLDQLNCARRRRVDARGIPFADPQAALFIADDVEAILPMQASKVLVRFQELLRS